MGCGRKGRVKGRKGGSGMGWVKWLRVGIEERSKKVGIIGITVSVLKLCPRNSRVSRKPAVGF